MEDFGSPGGWELRLRISAWLIARLTCIMIAIPGLEHCTQSNNKKRPGFALNSLSWNPSSWNWKTGSLRRGLIMLIKRGWNFFHSNAHGFTLFILAQRGIAFFSTCNPSRKESSYGLEALLKSLLHESDWLVTCWSLHLDPATIRVVTDMCWSSCYRAYYLHGTQ
jgi:hypothetical protein